jgi:hypothetical protein
MAIEINANENKNNFKEENRQEDFQDSPSPEMSFPSRTLSTIFVLLSELNTCQILGAYRNEIIQISAAQGT